MSTLCAQVSSVCGGVGAFGDGRRLGTGSCVSVRQTTTMVVRGLGRAFLCLAVIWRSVYLHITPCLREREREKNRRVQALTHRITRHIVSELLVAAVEKCVNESLMGR